MKMSQKKSDELIAAMWQDRVMGLNYQQMAEKYNVTRQTISKYMKLRAAEVDAETREMVYQRVDEVLSEILYSLNTKQEQSLGCLREKRLVAESLAKLAGLMVPTINENIISLEEISNEASIYFKE